MADSLCAVIQTVSHASVFFVSGSSGSLWLESWLLCDTSFLACISGGSVHVLVGHSHGEMEPIVHEKYYDSPKPTIDAAKYKVIGNKKGE